MPTQAQMQYSQWMASHPSNLGPYPNQFNGHNPNINQAYPPFQSHHQNGHGPHLTIHQAHLPAPSNSSKYDQYPQVEHGSGSHPPIMHLPNNLSQVSPPTNVEGADTTADADFDDDIEGWLRSPMVLPDVVCFIIVYLCFTLFS